MSLVIEVYHSNSSANNWVVAGIVRRVGCLTKLTNDVCIDVAKELKLTFKQKKNGVLCFKEIKIKKSMLKK